MVVDTSAILALLFGEAHAEWVAGQLSSHAGTLCMSTVNLTEVLILLKDRRPGRFAMLEEKVLGSGIAFIPPDVEQARLCAEARLRYPLNLGDGFAFALAVATSLPILTLDAAFDRVPARVVRPSD